jgi:hypothetical protein
MPQFRGKGGLNSYRSIDLIDVFVRVYDIPKEKKWAFCFDELEFAPKWLQVLLYRSLRSRSNQNILYKVSSSPILPKELEGIFLSDYSPTGVNDLDLIKMWNRPDSAKFSRELIKSLLKLNSISVSPDQYFGTNDLYSKKEGGTYEAGSEFISCIQELLNKDELFSNFMTSKGIDLNNPFPKSRIEKDTVYRKIKQTVYFRNEFIVSNYLKDIKPTYRSRSKTPRLYYGIEVLCKICEGNPRWLISLVNEIISHSGQIKPDETVQYDRIESTANRFKNSIKNIPLQVRDSNLSIESFISRIGNYFRDQVLGKKFQIEPASVFEFSITDSNDIRTIIEKGLFQGAFILADNKDDESLNFDFIGKPIKLSYLMYLDFNLPIRKSAEVISLSSINGNPSQPTLFE